jgi:hypothetical protein
VDLPVAVVDHERVLEQDGELDERRAVGAVAVEVGGALFVVDEAVTGFDRLGKWFAAERHGLEPDLATFAPNHRSGAKQRRPPAAVTKNLSTEPPTPAATANDGENGNPLGGHGSGVDRFESVRGLLPCALRPALAAVKIAVLRRHDLRHSPRWHRRCDRGAHGRDGATYGDDETQAVVASADGSLRHRLHVRRCGDRQRLHRDRVQPGNGGGALAESGIDAAHAIGVSPDGSEVFLTGSIDGGATRVSDYGTLACDASTARSPA